MKSTVFSLWPGENDKETCRKIASISDEAKVILGSEKKFPLCKFPHVVFICSPRLEIALLEARVLLILHELCGSSRISVGEMEAEIGV